MKVPRAALWIFLNLLSVTMWACTQGQSSPENNLSPEDEQAQVTMPSPPLIAIDDSGFDSNGDLCYHVACANGLTCDEGVCSDDNHPARIAVEPYPLPVFKIGDAIEFEVYSEDEDQSDKVFLEIFDQPEGSTFINTTNELNLVSYHFSWVAPSAGAFRMRFVAENRKNNDEKEAATVSFHRDLVIQIVDPSTPANLDTTSTDLGTQINIQMKP